ncbi:hypothetical protein [uncultured Roseibium sp.]|uniref:hypothetical protein n=1 Tax=uncultured Roseibium sp. TaxID=1936171 RepID=UPI0026195557|nr:hypothetical protein [uncultured Roseibium sp.]
MPRAKRFNYASLLIDDGLGYHCYRLKALSQSPGRTDQSAFRINQTRMAGLAA